MNNQAMRVVRIEANSTSDIFAVVVQDDHEVGTPEGFAHWNGNKWSWIDKRTSWTLALNRLDNNWISVDFSGEVVEYSNGKSSKLAMVASGVNDCCVIESNLYTVGLNGLISIHNSSNRNIVPNLSRDALYSIDSTGPNTYTSGSNGIVLKISSSESEIIHIDVDADLNAICCCEDGQVFAAGGKENKGVIVDVITNQSFPLSTRPGFIRASDSNEVWIVDWEGSVWLWSGENPKLFRFANEMSAFCLSRKKQLVFGGLDTVAIYHERSFKFVPLDLDSSFLYDE